MTYEELLDTADNEGLTVMEKPLTGSDGRIYKNRIAIRSGIDTTVEKSCVLAEEYLIDALESYRSKYGTYTTIDNYVIYFEPLAVVKMIK